ncbi:hypothetical protein PO909_000323 [Leuciscus waleckii]
MAVWTVYLSLCLLVALTASGEDNTSNSEAGSGLTPRDSGQTRPSAACMDGWSAFGNRCFRFFYNPQTWIDAERFCLQYDGNLASVHSLEEYAVIHDLIRSETQASMRAWIGGHDAVQEGVWLWSDGTEMNFQMWAPGEPNNLDGHENCLEMNLDYVKWNDDTCSKNKPFVCVKRTSM